ncbi:hypothetical protein [Brevibacillus choshinensis]|uniref:hypothetical protein n=1 Tax=Brevibacillus choshinensis TaxID=54911 RepID=UPI002E1EE015|nr:hypothetical protein [Brevibacillus choshinensis]
MNGVEPIYDDRAKEILRGLTKGKTRDELAIELGHKSYKTLDIYMRRRYFTWDRNKQTYVPMHTRVKSETYDWESQVSSRAQTVISLFQRKEGDARSIARKLGFNDHREMASYMRAKGFQWSPEAENYLKVHGEVLDSRESQIESSVYIDTEEMQQVEIAPSPRKFREDISNLDTFLPLLEMLDRNKEKLIDLIVPDGGNGKVPRYIVPGIFITKSVHMANTLDQMVREYSKEKNVSQRDIFTVALIEFFQRYGYESHVNGLLDNSIISKNIK